MGARLLEAGPSGYSLISRARVFRVERQNHCPACRSARAPLGATTSACSRRSTLHQDRPTHGKECPPPPPKTTGKQHNNAAGCMPERRQCTVRLLGDSSWFVRSFALCVAAHRRPALGLVAWVAAACDTPFQTPGATIGLFCKRVTPVCRPRAGAAHTLMHREKKK